MQEMYIQVVLRFALLALLAKAPRHGYDLKQSFERLLGGTWRVNAGQIYTTLNRLEQDGLVTAERVAQELLPDRTVYSLTERGHKEVAGWLEEPVTGLIRLRDEVFVKVILQLDTADTEGARALIARQRDDYLKAIAQVAAIESDFDEPTRLLLEGLVLRMEADLAWLDRCDKYVKKQKKT